MTIPVFQSFIQKDSKRSENVNNKIPMVHEGRIPSNPWLQTSQHRSLSLSHTERAPWIIMNVQMNDYLHIWISKETELVTYLSKHKENFRNFLFLMIATCQTDPEVSVTGGKCLHSAPDIFRLSPRLLCLFFALEILTPSLPKLSVFCLGNTVQTALDSS